MNRAHAVRAYNFSHKGGTETKKTAVLKPAPAIH
jgi:hypothetical protein